MWPIRLWLPQCGIDCSLSILDSIRILICFSCSIFIAFCFCNFRPLLLLPLAVAASGNCCAFCIVCSRAVGVARAPTLAVAVADAFCARKLKTLTILSAFLSLHISGLNCRLPGRPRVKPGTGQADRMNVCTPSYPPLCALCAFLNCNLINNSQLFCCLNSVYIKCLFTYARFVICNYDELRLGIVLLPPLFPQTSLHSPGMCTCWPELPIALLHSFSICVISHVTSHVSISFAISIFDV